MKITSSFLLLALVDKAAKTAHEAAIVNLGQCCLAGTRIFVEAPVYDDMISRLKVLAESRRVGDPFKCDTLQGPQVDQTQFDKVMSYIETATKLGVRLVTGGSRIGEKGFYIQPTVLADVTDSMSICREDISSGPVQLVIRFETVKELIERINVTANGLGAAVFTKDLDKPQRIAENVEGESFWTNCYNVVDYQAPFRGNGNSEFGEDLGKEGMDCYLQTKIITMPMTKRNF